MPDNHRTKQGKNFPSGRAQDLFIIDNSNEQWKALRYLRDWCGISSAMDIATGYFEIGALLGLDGEWQQLDRIRILMGDEVSKRTREAFEKALKELENKLDKSIEQTKENNDFLEGVPAIVEALQSRKISGRVYRERKFHAKAYITYPCLLLTSDVALFRQLCGLGADLVALHLLEDDYPSASWNRLSGQSLMRSPITRFIGQSDGVVAKGHPRLWRRTSTTTRGSSWRFKKLFA